VGFSFFGKKCWPFTAVFLESGRVGYTTKDKKKTLRFGSQESSYSELIGILITLLEVSAWILRITFSSNGASIITRITLRVYLSYVLD
jgi:hypothetical protein